MHPLNLKTILNNLATEVVKQSRATSVSDHSRTEVALIPVTWEKHRDPLIPTGVPDFDAEVTNFTTDVSIRVSNVGEVMAVITLTDLNISITLRRLPSGIWV